MSKAKHSSGPWSTDPRGGGNIRGGPFHEHAKGKFQTQVALATLDGHRCEEERDANAQLIASAPELLAERDRYKAALISLMEAHLAVFHHSLHSAFAAGNSTFHAAWMDAEKALNPCEHS